MENPGNIRQAMNRIDPRQRGLFAAAWALGYLAHMARGGAAAVTLGGGVGEFGLVHAPDAVRSALVRRGGARSLSRLPRFQGACGLGRAADDRRGIVDPARRASHWHRECWAKRGLDREPNERGEADRIVGPRLGPFSHARRGDLFAGGSRSRIHRLGDADLQRRPDRPPALCGRATHVLTKPYHRQGHAGLTFPRKDDCAILPRTEPSGPALRKRCLGDDRAAHSDRRCGSHPPRRPRLRPVGQRPSRAKHGDGRLRVPWLRPATLGRRAHGADRSRFAARLEREALRHRSGGPDPCPGGRWKKARRPLSRPSRPAGRPNPKFRGARPARLRASPGFRRERTGFRHLQRPSADRRPGRLEPHAARVRIHRLGARRRSGRSQVGARASGAGLAEPEAQRRWAGGAVRSRGSTCPKP